MPISVHSGFEISYHVRQGCVVLVNGVRVALNLQQVE
jgi:hypothetical protein